MTKVQGNAIVALLMALVMGQAAAVFVDTFLFWVMMTLHAAIPFGVLVYLISGPARRWMNRVVERVKM